MNGQITDQTTIRNTPTQLWRNPVDNIVYGTSGIPSLSFKEVDAYPIYDLSAHSILQQKFAKGEIDEDKANFSAFLDSDMENIASQYRQDVQSGGLVRQASLQSPTNSAVNILNIWTEVQGKQDRKFVAKNIAREIPVPNLLISIDKVSKFSGMEQIFEKGFSQLKELTYTRAAFTANKYGLKFVVGEEARLKNVHNVIQDSIAVASTKLDQRASFDTVTAAASLTTQAARGVWDTFVSGTNRSDYDPSIDLGIAKLAIEGSGVGGKLNRIGIHPITYHQYKTNSYIRGTANPTGVDTTSFEPGTEQFYGWSGIGAVVDQSFTQGKIYCVDNSTADATIAYFQGPQRIGTAHDEETGDDKYFIVDYHLATIVQSETGRLITGTTTPLLW
jgi:hypothetical protein